MSHFSAYNTFYCYLLSHRVHKAKKHLCLCHRLFVPISTQFYCKYLFFVFFFFVIFAPSLTSVKEAMFLFVPEQFSDHINICCESDLCIVSSDNVNKIKHDEMILFIVFVSIIFYLKICCCFTVIPQIFRFMD